MPEKGSDLCEELAEKNERLRSALESCQSWIDLWAPHAGACQGNDCCTCGRRAILYEANEALWSEK